MKSLFRIPRPGAVFLCLITSVVTHAHGASSWPSWRGTAGTGVAPGAQPPTTWSDDQNIKWKTKIPGAGFSTPIVWNDRIYLLTAMDTGKQDTPAASSPAVAKSSSDPAQKSERKGGKGGFGGGPKPTTVHEFAVIAVNRGNGKIEWQKTARKEIPHEGHHASHGFASASPITDGERLYVSFGSRGIFCFDLLGNLQWEKNLGKMRTRGGFGEGASPALAGDLVIINWDHEDQSFVAALDKKTGAELWRVSREGPSSWTTPLIVDVEGKLQAIVAGAKRTRSYDAQTGEVIWEAAGLTDNVIPMPVVGHGMVYVMSGFRGFSIQAIKLSSRGDITDTDNIVWHVRRGAPYVPSPVLSGNLLYMSKSNDARLSCLDAQSGQAYYQDQDLAPLRGIYASPLAANGYLYIVGREGVSMVIKDDSKFEIVATNKLSDRIDASPVALDKELFLRGHEYLYCIAEG